MNTRREVLGIACGLPVATAFARRSADTDPLPSWTDGDAKRAILGFVAQTTSAGSPDFVALDDRIAVFDNDGTLWPENPVPFEVAFALDTARELMARRPELKETPPYRALASGDMAALVANHLEYLLRLILDTHAGQTTEEFAASVTRWFATARHPRFDRPYSECTYQPMREVLRLLRNSGYKTYLVSGGSQDFMRVWARKVYGIPPEQVIGTVFKTVYELKADRPTLTILPEIALMDDKAGKPVAIHHMVGRRPVMCFGNSDGDQEMLQFTTVGHQPSFGLIVHHTDAEREYAYDSKPRSSGRLVEALAAAPGRGWVVVDMKRDWTQLFAPLQMDKPSL